MTDPADPSIGVSAAAASSADNARTGASATVDVDAGVSARGDAGQGGQRTSNGRRGNGGRVAFTGWVLYLLSWVTPSLDGRQFGATAFVDSVRLAWHFFSTGSILPGLAVTLGWLANFSIFPRLPCWLRVMAIIAPWLAFTVVLANLPARAAFFLYFYPWALGIALIHAARCSSRKAAS